MARKKQNKNTRGKTIQRQAAGPQRTPKARVTQNGSQPRRVEHNLIEQMGKKAGMHSTNGRMACEMYLSPSKPCVPVIPFSAGLRNINGSGMTQEICTAPPTAGTLFQGRRTETVTLGSNIGLGYILFFPDIAGDPAGSDIVYTDATYLGTGVIQGGATLGVIEGAMCNAGPTVVQDNATYRKFLSAKITLKVNESAADSREGAVMVYNGHNTLIGQTAAQIKALLATETYPNTVFSDGQEISLRVEQSMTPIVVTAAQTFDAFAVPNRDRCCGLIFTGFAGQQFDVEVEWSCFTWGHQIPRSMAPIIDTAAIECLYNCLSTMGTQSVGYTKEEDGRHTRDLLKLTEHHAILKLPKPIVSGLWPLIKTMALSAGPALLKTLF